MSPSQSSAPEGPVLPIESKLRHAWQQERRYYNVRGASRFVVWLVALLALDFLIDWGLFAKSGMSGNISVFLLLINISVLAWILWHEWLRFLKPYDPVITSLEVEKRHPGLTSLLVSYTQLNDSSAEDQPNISTELIGAMREQAIAQSRSLDFREIVDFKQLQKLFTVATCVLLVFGVLSMRWSDHFGVLLKRLAGADDRYPTKTQVMSVNSPDTVRIGDPAPITATAGGVLPDAGRLFIKAADSDDRWKELPMKVGSENDTFGRDLKGLSKDLLFYVRLGDDRSEERRIRVIDSPQVIGVDLVLEYPKYMNREPGKSDQLNLEVPEGTLVKWAVKCDPPVERCQVKVGEKTFAAEVDESGTTVSFELTANEALKYTFRWTEREKGFEYEDVLYAVKVTTDGLPDIDLLSPRSNGLATVQKTLKLTARASDDIGLSKAWLVYSVDGSEEKRIAIQEFAGATKKDLTHPWKLADTIDDLKPGSQVTFALEVADHHPDREAHLRRSATRQLTVVEPERYLEWYRTELAAQNDELKRSRDLENAASKVVKQIKVEEETPDQE